MDALTKIALGNGLFEELFINGFLLPTLATVFVAFGLAVGVLLVLLLSLYFLPLQLLFPIILVGGALVVLQRVWPALDTRKSPLIAVVIALVVSSLFFGVLHTRVAGGDWLQTVKYAQFGAVMGAGNILLGGTAFGMAAHVTNNALCPTVVNGACSSVAGPERWLPPAIFLVMMLVMSYWRPKP